MSSIRTVFPESAESAAALLRDPAVSASWDKPSALPEFRVSGLAGHLARQVFNVRTVLELPVPTEAPISLLDHYGRSEWVAGDLDSESNVGVRDNGEREAAAGPAALADRIAAATRAVPGLLAAEPADRVVPLPWAGWALSLDDFLITRLMEIAVHSDDLAVSVGVATPPVPQPAFDATAHLLVALATRRHGQVAVLRALSRAERAPSTIAAI